MSSILGLICLLVAGTATRVSALPGELDETFAGMSTASVGQNVMCHAVAPDGKIVLAGTSGSAIVVCRRLSNGDPDYSFGGDGTVSVTYPGALLEARSVAVQADGKIVVAGQGNYDGFRDFLVARLTTSGSLDYSFSGNGFASAWISTFANDAQKVLIQPDGKIVVVGWASIGADDDFAAARFNSDGTLDASFNGDGMASVGGFATFGANDRCYDAVLQANGKLVMVGGSVGFVLLDEDFALARLNIDGSLDDTFDGDGRLKTGFGDFYDRAYAVAIQPSDQRIVVVGQGSALGSAGRAARYYSSDGSLDGSFDGDGKMNLPVIAHDAVVNTAGKITLVGIDPNSVARALRLNSNGSLDPEWQTDGDVIIGNDIHEQPSLSLLADGRVLTVVPKGLDCQIGQWWADGYVDMGGKQAAAFADATFPPGSHEFTHDMAVLADGTTLVAGEVSNPSYTETDFALMRFLPDGRLDATFGVRGRAVVSLGATDVAQAMAIQPDGKIVLAGTTGSADGTNFMIARFNPNGALDPTFAFGGYNAMDFAGGSDQATSIALLPDGRIVVAGTVFNGARYVYGVALFRTDGTADPSFDLDGKQMFEFSVGPSHWASAVVVSAGGTRIIVGGSVGANFALVAFTLSGAVDTNFGSFGRATRDLGGSDYLEALAIGANGWIYAAGTRVVGGNADWALARWPPSAGLVLCNPTCPWTAATLDLGSTSDWVEAMDVRSDGHIVVGGRSGGNAHWAEFVPGGTTPSASGSVSYPGNGVTGAAVRFSGTNKIVLAGSHLFQGDHNMTVTRFDAMPNTTVSVDDLAPIGSTLRLAAPYPNPLAGRSTFRFELPQAQPVRLAIHDVAGRQVRLLQDGALTAGRHHRLWDGTDEQGRSVAAGVYFARLVAGTDHASASIVVLR